MPAVAPAVYVQIMVPVPPLAARLRSGGIEVVVALTPVRVGGFGTEVTVIGPDVDLFVTVMVSVNWQPVPMLKVDGTRVIDSDFKVQDPLHAAVVHLTLPVCVGSAVGAGNAVVWLVHLARTSLSVSVTSADEVPTLITKLKSLEAPGRMESAHELAMKYIWVVVDLPGSVFQFNGGTVDATLKVLSVPAILNRTW
ncbi:MAG: hypothetical protein HY203_01720 [Nitrospirae bacterium]|nr:hypothetical protein [Nitrospirota bacterium]